MLLFSVGNGAMYAPQYWQRHNELLRDICNGAMNSSAILAIDNELLHDGGFTVQREWGSSVSAFEKADTSTAYPYGAMNSFPGWQFVSELPTAVQGGEESERALTGWGKGEFL
jgi:hypothetical protein